MQAIVLSFVSEFNQSCTLSVNATLEDATVTGAGTYPYGSACYVTVEWEGYVSYATTVNLTEDTVLDVELEKVPEDDNIPEFR